MFRSIQIILVLIFALSRQAYAQGTINVPNSDFLCSLDRNGGWQLAKADSAGGVKDVDYRKLKKRLGDKVKSLKQRYNVTGSSRVRTKKNEALREKHLARDAFKYCENLNNGDTGEGPFLPGDAQIINYTFTATMRNPVTGVLEPTSNAVMEKVKSALRLWESVTDAKLRFVDGGFRDIAGLSATDLLGDKTLHVVLNKAVSSQFGCYTAYFNCGSTYSTGIVVLDPKNPNDLLLPHIIQQTGVATTARWSVSPGAVMSNCSVVNPSSRFEFFGFSEPDRAVLVQRYNPGAIYTISGTVSGPTKPAWVYAVNTVNGHVYSTMASESGSGAFTIPLLKAGNYHVVASSMFRDGTTTWYRSSGAGTNDPSNASVVTVSDGAREVKNINFSISTTPPPFSLLGAAAANGAVATMPAQQLANLLPNFANPGQTVSFYLRGDTYAGKVASIEAYGTNPDYHVVSFDANSGLISVAIHPGAASGARLLVAKSPTGVRIAGDVGLHISPLPSFVNSSITEQLLGTFNFDALNPTYWKQ